MKDSPKVNAEEFHSTKANMSLLKELLKDREVNKDAPKEKENIKDLFFQYSASDAATAFG